MDRLFEAQVIDSRHLELKQPIEIPAGSSVLVSIEPLGGVMEEQSWYVISAQGLALAYGEDEPEYPFDLIKEFNPEYEP